MRIPSKAKTTWKDLQNLVHERKMALCLCQYLHAHIEGEFSTHLKTIYDPKNVNHH